MTTRSRIASGLGLTAALLAATQARSQAAPLGGDGAARKACATRYEQAQILRNASKLVEAREALVACSQQQCQTAVRAECVAWFDQVTDSIPSVVLSAKTNGADQANVGVVIDGKATASRLDGKPIELDPGVHVFRFENGGFDPIDQQVLLVAGERNRLISVSFGRPEPDPALEARPPRPREAEPVTAAYRPTPALVYVLGGLAVVGAAGFGGLLLWGQSQRNDLESSCRPICTPSQVNQVHGKFVAADISLGVGAAALAAAAVAYLTRSESHASSRPERRPERAAANVSFEVTDKGVGLEVGGRF